MSTNDEPDESTIGFDCNEFGQACWRGDEPAVLKMLAGGETEIDFGMRMAIQGNQRSTVRLLISKGATDLDTGLLLAIEFGRMFPKKDDELKTNGRLPMIAILLNAGAKYSRFYLRLPHSSDLLFGLLTETDVRRSTLSDIPQIGTVFDRLAGLAAAVCAALVGCLHPPVLQLIILDYCMVR